MKVDPKTYFSGSSADALKGQQFTAGIRVFDIARPEAPREIGLMPTEGVGPHRIWYAGGRYAYASIHTPEFSDHVLAIVDLAEPTRPHVVGKFWLPGMWTGGGETPSFPKGKRYALHHALVAGNLAYGAWRDGGLTILDVGDPSRPKLLAHRNLDPPFGGGTHSPLPLPDRNLLVLADEANFADCSLGLRHIWLFDVREPANPVSFATMPVPSEADYCKKASISGRTISGKTDRTPSRARDTSSPHITMRACGSSTSRTPSSHAKPVSSCRPIPSACSIPAPIDRRSSSPPTASSTRRG